MTRLLGALWMRWSSSRFCVPATVEDSGLRVEFSDSLTSLIAEIKVTRKMAG